MRIIYIKFIKWEGLGAYSKQYIETFDEQKITLQETNLMTQYHLSIDIGQASETSDEIAFVNENVFFHLF